MNHGENYVKAVELRGLHFWLMFGLEILDFIRVCVCVCVCARIFKMLTVSCCKFHVSKPR